ncbi:(2Fe-2S)-binding protein [Roseateles sp. BYS96W]|uniref:(2Fe-2S)-binding protein n=1 Tax=Pelomonas nitida TaxID=3299027 RepID=A0ABW7GCI6_9BURK
MTLRLDVNGSLREVDADPDSPLLWVLRDELKLVGTKFGCGIGQCSACTVHINGAAVPSCQMPAGAAQGQAIRTIEGLARGEVLTAVQQAWLEHDVAQCGYCQAGQIMSATALLAQTPRPSEREIDDFMSRHLCRCGTYTRIRAAIRSAAERLSANTGSQS